MSKENFKEPEKALAYIQKMLKRIGTQGIYSALLLIHAFKKDATPKWAKNTIIGALAYFLSPIDGIPDLSPFLGFTDDIGVMTFGLVMVACYIDDEVRSDAKLQLNKLIGEFDEQITADVDKIL